MRTSALLTLFSTTALLLLLASCQSTAPKPVPVAQPMEDQTASNIDINIHVRHFTNDKCKQGVSKWVYSKLPFDEKDNYKAEETFVKHHLAADVKNGVCDNTVEMLDEKTGTLIYRCGGHSQSTR